MNSKSAFYLGVLLLGALAVGLPVLAPSLVVLFRVFKAARRG